MTYPDSISMQNYGLNNYGMNQLTMQNYGYNNLYADPSWQSYWQWSQQLDSINAQNQALAKTANQGIGTNNVAFGQTPITTDQPITTLAPTVNSVEPTKKKGKGAAILLTTGALAVAGTWFLASRGKSQGAKGLLEQVKAGWKSIGKKELANVVKFREVDGKKIFTSPNNKQYLNIKNNNIDDIVSKAKNLGIDLNPNLNLADDASLLKSTQFEFSLGDKNYKGLFRDGNIVSLKDGSTKLELGNLDGDLKGKVDDILSSLKTKTTPSDVTLKNSVYMHKFDEKTQALYMANAGDKNGFRLLKTNRYGINDDAIVALRGDNTRIGEAIEQAQKGNYESWGICEGLWTPKGSKGFFGQEKPLNGRFTGATWDDNVQLVIKNDQIVGYTKDGGKKIFNPNTIEFKALHSDFPEVFEKALEHKSEFVNPVMYCKAS